MANKRSPKKRRPVPKTILRLPDLDQAKSAVLNTLEGTARRALFSECVLRPRLDLGLKHQIL
jgi:hypothetical protein